MKQIHVGLTGLSRAGKTVFLTAAIHDFVEHTGRDLKEFKFNGWRYVANPVPLPNGVVPFPYSEHVKVFRGDPPRWPDRTVDITEFRIRMQLVDEKNRRAEGEIVFVDYPGERLLDVPLLETAYDDWADQTLMKLTSPPDSVRDAARESLECIGSLQVDSKGMLADDAWNSAQRVFGKCCILCHAAGTAIAPVAPVLLAAKNRSASASAPFFPLSAEMRQRFPGVHKRLKKEYAAYLKSSVAPFLQRIAACSHQIILVDVLDVLRTGVEEFVEIREQMQRALNCYRQANSGRFNYLLSMMPFFGKPLIRKVTFCATKVDQATRDHRENLISLLRDLFLRAEQALQFDRRTIKKIEFIPIAAHRCTDDVDTDHDGRQIVALRGRRMDSDDNGEELIYPGRVPQQWPEYKDNWQDFRFPDFLPRKLPDLASGRPLPHINMDQMLFSIVEELLP